MVLTHIRQDGDIAVVTGPSGPVRVHKSKLNDLALGKIGFDDLAFLEQPGNAMYAEPSEEAIKKAVRGAKKAAEK